MDVLTAYLIVNPDHSTKTDIQRIGGQWSLSAKGYFLTEEQKELLDSGDIPEPTLPSGIYIDDMITSHRISGPTYEYRGKIKNIGGRWVPSAKAWDIPIEKATYDEILAALM